MNHPLCPIPAHEMLFNPNLFRKINTLSCSDVGIPIYVYRLINGEIRSHIIHDINTEGTGFTVQKHGFFIYFEQFAKDNVEAYVKENSPILTGLTTDEAIAAGINMAQEKRLIKEKMIKDLDDKILAGFNPLVEAERLAKREEWLKEEAKKREKKRASEEAIQAETRCRYLSAYYPSESNRYI